MRAELTKAKLETASVNVKNNSDLAISSQASNSLIDYIDRDTMKVQRLAERRSVKSHEMRELDMNKIPIEDRFFKKVKKVESGCHEWQGYVMKSGYGQLHYNGKTAYAHVVAYKLEYGDIIGNLYVLHKCDNRKCVNPDHLFLGTFDDNMADMVSKVRQAAGEKNFHAKLTESQVIRIRNTIGKASELALIFNISQATINDIRSRRSWRHI